MYRPTLSALISLSLFLPGQALSQSRPDQLLAEDPQAGQPALSVSAGQVMLSWTESLAPAPGHRLRLAQWGESGLGPATTIASSEHWFVNWADFPGLLRHPDGAMASFVLQKRPGSPYAYGLGLLQRGASGAWSEPAEVHDASATEHGFASLWSWQGDTALAWLDGRATDPATAHEHGSGGAMALRAARFASDGSKREEWVLDPRTCDCCQTDATMTASGPVVVYRDRSAAEIRDIALVRWGETGWSEPEIVHADQWHMPGCPVNGPAIASRGEQLWVAWYSGGQSRPRVQLARSDSAEQGFAAPLELASGDSVLGRVDVAVDRHGTVWVSWVEESAGAQQLWLARVQDGQVGDRQALASLGSGRGTGFPRLAASADHLYIAWTDTQQKRPALRGRRLPLRVAGD